MVWNNGQQINPAHITVDFLSSVVIRTDSPVLLIFARFDQFGPDDPPAFDISIDGGASKRVVWKSVLIPQRLSLGPAGEHTVVIRGNPLSYRINTRFPLWQNVLIGFAIPAKYELHGKTEPGQHHALVTVTDSLGQGWGTPDPPQQAWTAQLADSGRWPGVVMTRGAIAERLADVCDREASCESYADGLDRDYPNATAYYFALGTNDFGIPQRCNSPASFEANMSALLRDLHKRNPLAALYLQTPMHRADEAQTNSCGNTLSQFRDAEQRMAQNLPWITLIDGFSTPFPQITQDGLFLADGVHLSDRGQRQYLLAVLQSLHLQSGLAAGQPMAQGQGR
jgi:lysophospholipase L1-like esterase